MSHKKRKRGGLAAISSSQEFIEGSKNEIDEFSPRSKRRKIRKEKTVSNENKSSGMKEISYEISLILKNQKYILEDNITTILKRHKRQRNSLNRLPKSIVWMKYSINCFNPNIKTNITQTGKVRSNNTTTKVTFRCNPIDYEKVIIDVQNEFFKKEFKKFYQEALLPIKKIKNKNAKLLERIKNTKRQNKKLRSDLNSKKDVELYLKNKNIQLKKTQNQKYYHKKRNQSQQKMFKRLHKIKVPDSAIVQTFLDGGELARSCKF